MLFLSDEERLAKKIKSSRTRIIIDIIIEIERIRDVVKERDAERNVERQKIYFEAK